MRKGLMLSTDLLVAITITIFLLGLNVFKASIVESSAHEVVKSVEAGDVLAVLDKSGVLAGENSTRIQEKLELLCSDYEFSAKYFDESRVNYFNISLGGSLSEYSFARRVFYGYDNKNMGVAVLKLG
jgi:hypothetical protein